MSKQAPNAVYLLTCQDVGFYGSPGALSCSGPGAGAFSYGSKCHVGEAVMAPQPTIQFSRQRVGNASYSSSDLILEREPARAGWGGAMWPQPVLEYGVGGSLRHSQGKGTALRVSKSKGVSLESKPWFLCILDCFLGTIPGPLQNTWTQTRFSL